MLAANTLQRSCAVCAYVLQVLQQFTSTSSRIIQATPRSLAACAASDILIAFVVQTGCMELPYPVANGLYMRVCRQLVQSGLVDSISGALAATAEDLQAQQAQPRHGAARYWPVLEGASSDLVMFQHQLLRHSLSLLAAWAALFEFCVCPDAGGSSAVAAQQWGASRSASALAAVHLGAAIMDLISQRIPQLLAADRTAVLQAVQCSIPAVCATVTGCASQLFDCVCSV